MTKSNGWAISFAEADAKSAVGRQRYVHNISDLKAFVSRGGGDVLELHKMLQAWGQGSLWLHLTDEQFALLQGKKPPGRETSPNRRRDPGEGEV